MVVDLDGEPCACGSYGCVETYASGPRMVARAKRRGWRTSEAVDAAVLSADAAAGDGIAVAIFDDGAQALAAGIVATAVTVDLTTVVIGGGVAKAGPVLFDPVQRWVKRLAQLPFVSRAHRRTGPARQRRPARRRPARLGLAPARLTQSEPFSHIPVVAERGLPRNFAQFLPNCRRTCNDHPCSRDATDGWGGGTSSKGNQGGLPARD